MLETFQKFQARPVSVTGLVVVAEEQRGAAHRVAARRARRSRACPVRRGRLLVVLGQRGTAGTPQLAMPRISGNLAEVYVRIQIDVHSMCTCIYIYIYIYIYTDIHYRDIDNCPP